MDQFSFIRLAQDFIDSRDSSSKEDWYDSIQGVSKAVMADFYQWLVQNGHIEIANPFK